MRWTPNRRAVYDILLTQRDHPTVAELYERVRRVSPKVSLATVYNNLQSLVEFGFVKQINFERESSRYCPNLNEHCHFQDAKSGEVIDVCFKPGVRWEDILVLPAGVVIQDFDLTLRGIMPSNNIT